MVNYYVEFGLDRGADSETLKEELVKLRRKWQNRANSATTLEARQDAEKKMQMIREATAILLVPAEREKYDGELDKNPVLTGEQMALEDEQVLPIDPSLLDTAAAMDALEVAYNEGKYNTITTIAGELIQQGKATDRVYRILALCYIETDNPNMAAITMQNLILAMPEDIEARYWAAFFDLRLLENRAEDARSHIDWLLQSEEGTSARVAALDVEYHIDVGDLEMAAAKTESYKQKFGHDPVFCQGVGAAYRQYADSNWTSYGGDIYFDDKQSFENWNKYFQMSLEIHPNMDMQTMYKNNKELVCGVSFVKENLPSIAFAFILGAIWSSGGPGNGTFLLGLAFILSGIYIAVFSFPPKWMVHRSQYTGKLYPLYEIARTVSKLVVKAFKACVWVVKTFIRIIMELLKISC